MTKLVPIRNSFQLNAGKENTANKQWSCVCVRQYEQLYLSASKSQILDKMNERERWRRRKKYDRWECLSLAWYTHLIPFGTSFPFSGLACECECSPHTCVCAILRTCSRFKCVLFAFLREFVILTVDLCIRYVWGRNQKKGKFAEWNRIPRAYRENFVSHFQKRICFVCAFRQSIYHFICWTVFGSS